MTPDEIREVVKLTIDELVNKSILSIDTYQTILKEVDPKLYDYFKSKANTSAVSYAIRQLLNDQYIDIIFLQYRDGKTLEDIAYLLNKDVSTIKRNKKRLILRLYSLLDDR